MLLQQYLPFTVLKHKHRIRLRPYCLVATVLTVYGIETIIPSFRKIKFLLQQYLPFTVLKLSFNNNRRFFYVLLQQYLPFTVLKRIKVFVLSLRTNKVATVLTVYGIETWKASVDQRMGQLSVATVLTVYGIETTVYNR